MTGPELLSDFLEVIISHTASQFGEKKKLA